MEFLLRSLDETKERISSQPAVGKTTASHRYLITTDGDIFSSYDNLISRYAPPKPKADSVCAVGIQIAVEKITVALAAFQSSSIKALVKEQRSFGFWSPRRCDVYVVSYQPGYLQDRLEVVAYLWQHKISADLMYESGLPNAEHENYVDLCVREGIL